MSNVARVMTGLSSTYINQLTALSDALSETLIALSETLIVMFSEFSDEIPQLSGLPAHPQ